MKGTRGSSSKTTGAKTSNAITISVAEETNAPSVGDNRACSDRGSREDKYSDGTTVAKGSVGATQPICHGGRQEEELLCLWRFWVHGLPL